MLWSKNSVESDWVLEEAEVGRQRGVLIPVLIDESVVMPLGFRMLQASRLPGWTGDQSHPEAVRLFKGIEMIVGSTPLISDSRQVALTRLFDQGTSLMEQGRSAEAVPVFERAVKLKPDYSAAFFKLGLAHEDSGRFDKAVSAYRRAVEVKPHYPAAYLKLGISLERLGDLSSAIETYKKLLEISPGFPVAEKLLQRLLLRRGKPGTATENPVA